MESYQVPINNPGCSSKLHPLWFQQHTGQPGLPSVFNPTCPCMRSDVAPSNSVGSAYGKYCQSMLTTVRKGLIQVLTPSRSTSRLLTLAPSPNCSSWRAKACTLSFSLCCSCSYRIYMSYHSLRVPRGEVYLLLLSFERVVVLNRFDILLQNLLNRMLRSASLL